MKVYISVKILLEISTLVESMHIQQTYADLDNQDARYFFGLHDLDWAPIIIDMFSRKISKLYITNYFYRRYMSNRSAEALREVT